MPGWSGWLWPAFDFFFPLNGARKVKSFNA